MAIENHQTKWRLKYFTFNNIIKIPAIKPAPLA